MLRGMEQQLANMKKAADEHINERERQIQETQEGWQEAITRASEAEGRARELQNTVSSLQEQLHINQVHQQLWRPDQPLAPDAQETVNSSTDSDTLMKEPAQVMNNPASEESNGHIENDMDTVNRLIFSLYTSSILLGIIKY